MDVREAAEQIDVAGVLLDAWLLLLENYVI